MNPDLHAQPARTPCESDDSAVDDFAAAMKARLAEMRAAGHTFDHPGAQRMHGLTQELLHAIRTGNPVEIAVRCMQIRQRGAKDALIAGAWYSNWQEIGGPAPRVPDNLFGALMDLYWQVKGANEDAAGELEPVFESEVTVVTRMLCGDLFSLASQVPAHDVEAIEPGMIASMKTIKAVTEAETLLREVAEPVAGKVRGAFRRLLDELGAARSPATATGVGVK